MQQHTRRLAFLLAASMLAGLGVLAACDTDNAIQPLPGGGSTTSSSSSSGKPQDDDDDDTTPGDDDDDAGDGGTKDAGCGFLPVLRKTEKGFFCGFFRDAGPDSGGATNCAHDETCCNSGATTPGGQDFPPAFCAATTLASKTNKGQATCSGLADGYGSSWNVPGSTTWECASTSNCAGGRKCCAFSQGNPDAGKVNVGNAAGSGAPPAACKVKWMYKTGGTKCANSCGEGEIELCSATDTECSDGKTCKPAGSPRNLGNRDIGYCE